MTSHNHGIRVAIDLGPVLTGLEQPLQLIGEGQRRDDWQVYVNAARPQVERAVFDVLSQAVTAFNDAGAGLLARLEYAAGNLHIVVEPVPDAAPPDVAFSDSRQEKVTLRLPRELKDRIDRAAGRHGISANNWYVRELSRTIQRQVNDSLDAADRDRGRRRGAYRGRSLKGFVGGD